jgi:hypothetical protein
MTVPIPSLPKGFPHMPRPSVKPTEQSRRIAKTMATCGMKQEDIATALNIRSAKTLRKHYRQELKLGAIEATTHVARTLYQMATSGKCPPATTFWLNKNGWGLRPEAQSRPAVLPDFIVVAAKQGQS